MYRIVLDTNILISALISKKATPHILYQAWWEYKLYSLITSTYQISEFERVVQYPKLQRFLKQDEVQTMSGTLCDRTLSYQLNKVRSHFIWYNL